MKSLSLIVFLSISLVGYCQSRYVITDSVSDLPLSYATVKVLNTNKGQIADALGVVVLDIDTSDSVVISRIGYNTLTITGAAIRPKIQLLRKVDLLDTITVIQYKYGKSSVVGLGEDFTRRRINCNMTRKDVDPDCYPVEVRRGTEIAERILLPDSTKAYVLKTLYFPVRSIGGCWEPVLVRVFNFDPVTREPGEQIFERLIDTPNISKKGVLEVDVRGGNIIMSGVNSFAISITRPADISTNKCLTLIIVRKSTKNMTFSRVLQSPSFRWFVPFSRSQEDPKGRSSSTFAVELQEVMGR